MNLELILKWSGPIVALGITISFVIKIAPSFRKIIFKEKNNNTYEQKVNATTENRGHITTAQGENAVAINQTHIYIHEETSGKRRKALKDLKKASKDLLWAIDQSKNYLNKNTSQQYITNLRAVFESNIDHFKKTDLDLLEPIIEKLDYRKTFSDLETPCNQLIMAIDSLKE